MLTSKERDLIKMKPIIDFKEIDRKIQELGHSEDTVYDEKVYLYIKDICEKTKGFNNIFPLGKKYIKLVDSGFIGYGLWPNPRYNYRGFYYLTLDKNNKKINVYYYNKSLHTTVTVVEICKKNDDLFEFKRNLSESSGIVFSDLETTAIPTESIPEYLFEMNPQLSLDTDEQYYTCSLLSGANEYIRLLINNALLDVCTKHGSLSNWIYSLNIDKVDEYTTIVKLVDIKNLQAPIIAVTEGFYFAEFDHDVPNIIKIIHINNKRQKEIDWLLGDTSRKFRKVARLTA